jgi:hypothetical protein
MAKAPSLTTITSGYASNTQLNSNFTAIQAAFENTLSLDGSTPNAMNADLDMNSKDILNVNEVGTSYLRINGQLVVPTDYAVATDATDVDYNQGDTGAVSRTVANRLQDYVSVKDFGAVGNGVANDTAAIQAALNAASHVFVPEGTYLITSTITVPERKKLEMASGWATVVGAFPLARLVKSASMTTAALVLETGAVVVGGGVVGLAGNTGDNVQLRGNSAKLMDFFTSGAGRDGVRVGDDSVYANCNSTVIERVWSRENGRHGFYVHEGVPAFAGAGANTNQGTMLHCIAVQNGGDGIKIGCAYWVTVINALTEINQGYGLNLSGALDVVGGSNYPECRRANIIGGDFNEGNVAGQVFDQSYFSLFVNADSTAIPTNAGNAYQGSGRRTCLSTLGYTTFEGGTITTNSGQVPFTLNDGLGGVSREALTIQRQTTGSNGDGTSIRNRITTDGTTFVDASRIETVQNGGGQYNLIFKVWNTSGEETFVTLNANAQVASFSKKVIPASDNLLDLGSASNRWRVVYAGTGTINTSDQNEKQDIDVLNAAELRVAVALKGLIKKFRFKDAVSLKGDDARIHVGVIAQEVVAAFAAEGLDAYRYGMLCYDAWEAEPAITDAEGEVTSPAKEAGGRFGIRYEELLAFIISAI